jgi:hypothetical protein
VAHKNAKRRSAVDTRTTRHEGYAISPRARKPVKEVFGWMKTIALQRKTHFRGPDRTKRPQVRQRRERRRYQHSDANRLPVDQKLLFPEDGGVLVTHTQPVFLSTDRVTENVKYVGVAARRSARILFDAKLAPVSLRAHLLDLSKVLNARFVNPVPLV